MNKDGLHHLCADCLHRIQRSHGFLKDHADLAPAQAAHLWFGQGQQIGSVESDGAAGARSFRQQAHCCEGGHGLSRSAFPRQRRDLTLCDLQ